MMITHNRKQNETTCGDSTNINIEVKQGPHGQGSCVTTDTALIGFTMAYLK